MELTERTAVELAALLREGTVSAREVVTDHLDRIEATNPTVNAVVTLVAEAALEAAHHADTRMAAGEAVGVLHGLPVVHKDLFQTAGIRTTKGSPLHAEWVPDEDHLIVARLGEAGAITLGKSNTPEFGAGSQTFNTLFGATRNPHDPSRTVGGSSGGAAAALASGMVPIADGSDMGGSLRNPASFCGVVGFRPSPGRVPSWPSETPWSPLSVHGPMARTVDDVALVMQAIAGPDARSPLSLSDPPSVFARVEPVAGARVVWTDLGLPYDDDIRQALAPVADLLSAAGWTVVGADPPLEGVDRVFSILRAWHFEVSHGPTYDIDPGRLKETIRWNVAEARRLTASDLAWAERRRSELMADIDGFLAPFDAMLLPTVQVPPFDVATEWPSEVGGVPMHSYIDWMRSCSDVSVPGLPAVSVPAATTSQGLPVGLQIVGRRHGDVDLLGVASAVEAIVGATGRPVLPA